MNALTFPNRLRIFRSSRGISQVSFAETVGVSKVTVIRWENGSAKPSPLAVERLQAIGFGPVQPNETNLVETPLIKLQDQLPLFRDAGTLVDKDPELFMEDRFKVKRNGTTIVLKPAPYVVNGPPNQVPFFRRLIKMQVSPTKKEAPRDENSWGLRLSSVESVENTAVKPCQFVLENPRKTAAHWNPNYGSHGWHRYIGRFPPHLVRALLNSFGASSETVVCDPFVGSGTTLVECRLLGIPAIGIEICPLSALISRVKSCFPSSTHELREMAEGYGRFFVKRWTTFARGRSVDQIPNSEIAQRPGNLLDPFPNYERWLTGKAFLGVSITIEYARTLKGYLQDVLLVALSSKMRSIGNVDVDVARAEYSKTPRGNVEVERLVLAALQKMIKDIDSSVSSHKGLIGLPRSVRVINSDVLGVDLPSQSIDHVITSPPYGVEASSYLRTHLLSYRCLRPYLQEDPYEFGDRVIGSEYVCDTKTTSPNDSVARISSAFTSFFDQCLGNGSPDKVVRRAHMMMQFFDDIHRFVQKMNRWLRPKGRVAFVIGNKRIGDHLVPTNTIVREIFSANGFTLTDEIKHKLKCNNTNSQVPWQERVIQDEFVLLFKKH